MSKEQRFKSLSQLRKAQQEKATATVETAENDATELVTDDTQPLSPKLETLIGALIESCQSLDNTMANFKMPKVELNNDQVTVKVDDKQIEPVINRLFKNLTEFYRTQMREEFQKENRLTPAVFAVNTVNAALRVITDISFDIIKIKEYCYGTKKYVAQIAEAKLESEIGTKPELEAKPSLRQSVQFYLWRLPVYHLKKIFNGETVRCIILSAMLVFWVIGIGFLGFIAYDNAQLRPFKTKYEILRQFSRRQQVTSEDFDRIDMYFSDPNHHHDNIKSWCDEVTAKPVK